MWNESTRSDQVLVELCDADSLWGPLVFLRPERDQRLTTARLLLICALYGIFYGMCANLVLALAHRLGGRPVLPIYCAPTFLTLTSFLCGKLSFARAWNRRAHQFTRRRAWAEANGRAPSLDQTPDAEH